MCSSCICNRGAGEGEFDDKETYQHQLRFLEMYIVFLKTADLLKDIKAERCQVCCICGKNYIKLWLSLSIIKEHTWM